MREYVVRLRFVKHCLGHIRRSARLAGKRQAHYLLPRSPAGRVVFLPTWWQAILVKAAEVFCRHQQAVREIRFALELDGEPRPVPQQLFCRRAADNKFVLHEAFWPGDEIAVRCTVPSSIPDDDFRELLRLAGSYFGISPACSYQYGFFAVVDVAPAVAL